MRLPPAGRPREFGPPELRVLPHWVCTRLTDKNGNPNSKPPYVSNGNGRLRVAYGPVDERAHMDYPTARDHVRNGTDGMQWAGFVTLPALRVTGVDLDGCRNPRTGQLGFCRPKRGNHLGFWAPALVAYLKTYWSVSPSGTGLRAWARGVVPDGQDREGGHGKWTHIGLEMYSQGQYLTETGIHLEGTDPHMRAVGGAIEQVADAADVLNKAVAHVSSRFQDLWREPGDSESDLTLANWLARFTRDPDTLELLLRLSGAYRAKWDQRRGTSTWLAEEVVRPALNRIQPTEDPVQKIKSSILARKEALRQIAEEEATAWVPPPVVEAQAWLDADLPDPLYRVKDLAVEGANILLNAEPKTGKTTLLINLVKGLADGTDFLGHKVTDAGRVCYVNAEMPALHFRMWLREAGIEGVERVTVVNTLGEDLDLRRESDRAWLAGVWKENGIRHVILDTLAALFPGEENSNTEVRDFLKGLDAMKKASGVQELILAHHLGNVVEEGKERSRGASYLMGWADDIWTLTKEKDVRFFRAEGRSAYVEVFSLDYEQEFRRLTRGKEQKSRMEVRAEGSAETIALHASWLRDWLKENPGATSREIRSATNPHGAVIHRGTITKATKLGVERGWIRVEEDGPRLRHYAGKAVPTVPRAVPRGARAQSPAAPVPSVPTPPNGGGATRGARRTRVYTGKELRPNLVPRRRPRKSELPHQSDE